MGFMMSEWDEKLLKYGHLFETKLMDLSVNIPLEEALDLGWEILAECFEPNETGLKLSLIRRDGPSGPPWNEGAPMAVKLTKNELKVQKDRLKQFQRYLPTLQLKKQQLQSVVMQVTAQLGAGGAAAPGRRGGTGRLGGRFRGKRQLPGGQAPGDVRPTCGVRPGEHRRCHRSGVQELSFEEIQYDVADYPLWVDTAAVRLRGDRPAGRSGKDPPPPGGASGAGAALHGPAGEPV